MLFDPFFLLVIGVFNGKATPPAPSRDRTNPLPGVFPDPGKGLGVIAACVLAPNGRRLGVLALEKTAKVGLGAFVADLGKGLGVVIMAPLVLDCGSIFITYS